MQPEAPQNQPPPPAPQPTPPLFVPPPGYVLAPAAQPKGGKGKGIMKWGLFGCLGIFGAIGLLVVIAIVLIAAAAGGSSTAASGGKEDVHVALAQGASGEISPGNLGEKKSKVTILQIVDNAPSSNQFTKPDPGKKYVAFEIEIEATGKQSASSLDWKLRDSTDFETDDTFASSVGGPSLDQPVDLTPGGKIRGWVIFQIAQNATVKWLRADPNFLLSGDLYFDAPQ